MIGVELLVGSLAGAVGAVLRHELTTRQPLRALHVVNVVGSVLLGVVAGSTLWDRSLPLAVAVGGFGGLTSFSSWMVGARDAVRGRGHEAWRLAGHVLLPAGLAVVGCLAGIAVGRMLTGGAA